MEVIKNITKFFKDLLPKKEIKPKRIWHISDTHSHHRLLTIPENIDIVIHSGDESNYKDQYQNEPEFRDFILWFANLPIKHKVEDSNTYQSNEEEVETRIYPLIRKWFIRDREYWKSLGITLDELNNKNIYPLKSFKVINKKGEEWEFDVENQFSFQTYQ